jgi:hypothetical protein
LVTTSTRDHGTIVTPFLAHRRTSLTSTSMARAPPRHGCAPAARGRSVLFLHDRSDADLAGLEAPRSRYAVRSSTIGMRTSLFVSHQLEIHSFGRCLDNPRCGARRFRRRPMCFGKRVQHEPKWVSCGGRPRSRVTRIPQRTRLLHEGSDVGKTCDPGSVRLA